MIALAFVVGCFVGGMLAAFALALLRIAKQPAPTPAPLEFRKGGR